MSFFYDKKCKNYITTERFLFWTREYAISRPYLGWIDILEYVSPYTEEVLDEIIMDFKNKAKKNKIHVDVYKNDLNKIELFLRRFDPSRLPRNEGALWDVQKTELDFVKEILFDIYENTDLKPFMDFGTLLGAVRHKGFVPWDDDVDFTLLRDDYEKLIDYLSKKYIWVDTSDWDVTCVRDERKYVMETLDKYPNQTFVVRLSRALKCFNGTSDHYHAVDFFALDYYNDRHNVPTLQGYIDDLKKEYVKIAPKKMQDWFDFYKKEIGKNLEIVKDSTIIHGGIDNYGTYFYNVKAVRRKEDIFPLKKLKFEDAEFYAPNNPHEYLKAIYNNYLRMPANIKIAPHQKEKYGFEKRQGLEKI